MATSTNLCWQTERVARRSGQIRLHGAEDFAAMRAAGALTAEALDLIGPLVKPGVTTASLDRFAFRFARDHGAYPAPPELPRLSQVDLHFDQSRRVPRDTGRDTAARRRHPQYRCEPDRRRLAWRCEPHVRCRGGSRQAQRLIRRRLQSDDARHRSNRAWSDNGHIGYAIQTYAEAERCSVVPIFAATGLESCFATSRTSCMSAERGKAFRCAPACSSPSSR